MGLRSFLDNPNGGQIFSAFAAIVGLLAVGSVIGFSAVTSFEAGEGLRFGEIGLLVLIGAGIARIVQFLRSRHGSR